MPGSGTVGRGRLALRWAALLSRFSGLAAIVAVSTLVLASPATAGLKPAEAPAESAPAEPSIPDFFTAAAAYRAWLKEHAPGFVEPLIDYAALDLPQPVCTAGAPPKVRAILIGASNPGEPFTRLVGPDNDLGLLGASLKARGVADTDLAILKGADASRLKLAEVLVDTLRRVGCGDRVFLYFSGHAARPSAVPLFIPKAVTEKHENVDYDALLKEEYSFPSEDVKVLRWVDGSGLFLALNGPAAGSYDLVATADISDFMTNVRNRQADIAVSLDTSFASLADLAGRQQRAGDTTVWNLETGVVPEEQAPFVLSQSTPLAPNHGGFAVFYSSVGDSNSVEMGFDDGAGGKTTYGVFSFRLANVIQNRDSVTVRALADSLKVLPEEAIAEEVGRNSQRYRIEASDPEMELFSDGAGRLPRSDAIMITKPTPKRGAASIERPEVEIEGHVDWSSPARAVLVDGKTALLKPDGSFSYTAKLKPGLNAIDIVALTGDARTHEKRLEFVFEGDRKALEGEGRRYAVIIANENYDAPTSGFDPLLTPFEDADAIAAILKSKYGFETEASQPGGKPFSLVLKDAGRHEIETVLYKIGLAAGEKDTVLVYYAGHGIYEERTTIAFWVPTDAESGVPISYLSASSIAEAVQRMQANKVIVISDSCFSGALLRGGGEAAAKIDQADRDRALLSLSQRRSRILISSGNNEPVEDQGGQGHSVFARALLTGLEDMRHDAFSARELFDGYILPLVAANADQEPQYRPLERTGHEGGDVVFVKVRTE